MLSKYFVFHRVTRARNDEDTAIHVYTQAKQHSSIRPSILVPFRVLSFWDAADVAVKSPFPIAVSQPNKQLS